MNRASTVWASTRRALNRNALSGGSGFTCATAAGPATSAATTRLANALRRRFSAAFMRGLRSDPLEVGRQAIADGDSHNLGKFVGVMLADRLLHTRIKRRTRFNRERDLASRFDLTAPVIQ